MRVLLLTQVLPYPADSGPKVKTLNVIKSLAANHEITLASFVRGDQTEACRRLEQWCAAVHSVPIERAWPGELWYGAASLATRQPFTMRRDRRVAMHALVARLSAAQRFDIVHADQLNMAQYATSLHGVRKVLDAHNALWRLFERMWRLQPAGPRKWLLAREWPLLKSYEGEMCRSFDAILTVSREDGEALEEAAGRELPLHTIPITVATADCRVLPRPEQPTRIVHIGTMYWPPNIDAVNWFVETIWPAIRLACPGVTFDVVGAQPPAQITRLGHAGSGINVTGYIADTMPYLEHAAVFVVPLRAGSGMRVKILTALAHGVPVVTTSLGCEGLKVTNEHDVLIADTPEQFSTAVVRLLNDRDLASRLASNGRRLVESQYDSAVAVRLLEDAYATTEKDHATSSC
jgi:glycosyltransferase involved in cell wall biosynthesis